VTDVEARPTLPAYALDDIDALEEAVHRDGLAFVPGVLSPDEVQALREAIDRCRGFGFDATRELIDHYKCVFNREHTFLEMADRAGIVDLAERLMGDQCHLVGMTAWRSRPGYGEQPLHADRVFCPLPEHVLEDESIRLPVYICTAHYYLDDIDEELSPTWVLPGSHRSGRSPAKGETEWRGRPAFPVLCKAGDALFFRSEVWHRGSMNRTTERTRYLLQVHYSQRDISSKFSPWPFQLNPEITSTANERQLRLLGKHPEGAYG
jgi:ectoine hydroxylase-related dioxygenase (phytanoyl-CoA dioxygenase family)